MDSKEASLISLDGKPKILKNIFRKLDKRLGISVNKFYSSNKRHSIMIARYVIANKLMDEFESYHYVGFLLKKDVRTVQRYINMYNKIKESKDAIINIVEKEIL